MPISRLTAGACVAAVLALAAPAGAVVVNVSGAGPEGTVVDLAPGTYEVTLTATDYSPWSSNSGCDLNGMNCSTGFVANYAVDFGLGGTNFNHSDGFQFGQKPAPGDNHIYATGAQALASFKAGPVVYAPSPVAADPDAYLPLVGNYRFTLAAAQKVNFFILDYPYGDNRGGITLNVAAEGSGAVPEPAAWALMILGFGGAGTALRRRRPLGA